MNIEEKLITPEMAVKMLKKNTSNRPLKKRNIMKMANDMMSGRWVDDTGEMIKISQDGVLIDGQNRLHALIQSGTSQRFLIGYGFKENVFRVLDTGKSRSASDIFHIHGIKNSSHMSAIINRYKAIRIDGFSSEHQHVTTGELLDIYNGNIGHRGPIEWQEIYSISTKYYLAFQKILPKADIGGFMSTFMDVDEYKGKDFMRQLCQGTDITNDIIVTLRNKIIADKLSPNNKMITSTKRALIIKSWNYFARGEHRTTLRFRNEENHPKIYGLDKISIL